MPGAEVLVNTGNRQSRGKRLSRRDQVRVECWCPARNLEGGHCMCYSVIVYPFYCIVNANRDCFVDWESKSWRRQICEIVPIRWRISGACRNMDDIDREFPNWKECWHHIHIARYARSNNRDENRCQIGVSGESHLSRSEYR